MSNRLRAALIIASISLALVLFASQRFWRHPFQREFEILHFFKFAAAGFVNQSVSWLRGSLDVRSEIPSADEPLFGSVSAPQVSSDASCFPHLDVDSPDEIVFAVVMATYHRKDNSSARHLHNVACMLNAQTHRHWHLFVVGDKYEPEEEMRAALSSIDPCRAHIFNLEQPGERGILNNTRHLWLTGGTKANNFALNRTEWFFTDSQALAGDRVVIACLDDDDLWDVNHLETLAARYRLYPSAQFVYTRFRLCQQLNGFPDAFLDGLNNQLPRPGLMIRASASWKLKEFWGWRGQSIHEMRQPPGPGDARLWARMAEHLTVNKRNYSFVPMATGWHISEMGSKCPGVVLPNPCADSPRTGALAESSATRKV